MEVEATAGEPCPTRPVSAAELIDALRSLCSLPDATASQVEGAAAVLARFSGSAAFPASLAGVLSTLCSTLASAVVALLRVWRTGPAAVQAPASPAAQDDPLASPLTPPSSQPCQAPGLNDGLKTASLSALQACTRLLRCLLEFCHEKDGVERYVCVTTLMTMTIMIMIIMMVGAQMAARADENSRGATWRAVGAAYSARYAGRARGCGGPLRSCPGRKVEGLCRLGASAPAFIARECDRLG